MKRYILLVLFSLFILPIKTLGVVCNIEDKYEAEINIVKNKINIDEKVNINVISNDLFNLSFENKNKDIVSINKDGIITGLKNGTASIIVNVNFLENNAVVATCPANIDIEVLSSDSKLKSLNIKEINDFKFDSNTLEYSIEVPYNIDKINIEATPSSETSKVSGIGRKYLNEGLNSLLIVVTSSDNSTTTYKLNVTRLSASNDNTLKNLIVEGYVLEPKFNSTND